MVSGFCHYMSICTSRVAQAGRTTRERERSTLFETSESSFQRDFPRICLAPIGKSDTLQLKPQNPICKYRGYSKLRTHTALGPYGKSI
jgi:hypothetical protein